MEVFNSGRSVRLGGLAGHAALTEAQARELATKLIAAADALPRKVLLEVSDRVSYNGKEKNGETYRVTAPFHEGDERIKVEWTNGASTFFWGNKFLNGESNEVYPVTSQAAWVRA